MVKCGVTLGWPENAPFDAIIVTAGGREDLGPVMFVPPIGAHGWAAEEAEPYLTSSTGTILRPSLQ